MTLYYFLFLSIALSLIALLTGYFFWPKKNIGAGLFAEALRNENSGHYEEAMLTYENALTEVRKTRFQGNLENKIIQRLKVLHTATEYKNNFHGRLV